MSVFIHRPVFLARVEWWCRALDLWLGLVPLMGRLMDRLLDHVSGRHLRRRRGGCRGRRWR